MRLLPIVEGDGDMAAVPELVRRVANEHAIYDLEVLRPHKRGDLPKVRSRFSDFLRTAELEESPILWVLDYDCADCTNAERDAVELRQRSLALRCSVPIEFVFMVKEYETLFLADHETTKAVFSDIASALSFPALPESVRDAKGWLSQARPKGFAYKPTQHQQKLTARVNLARLRSRSKSFVNFETALLRLLGTE